MGQQPDCRVNVYYVVYANPRLDHALHGRHDVLGAHLGGVVASAELRGDEARMHQPRRDALSVAVTNNTSTCD